MCHPAERSVSTTTSKNGAQKAEKCTTDMAPGAEKRLQPLIKSARVKFADSVVGRVWKVDNDGVERLFLAVSDPHKGVGVDHLQTRVT